MAISMVNQPNLWIAQMYKNMKIINNHKLHINKQWVTIQGTLIFKLCIDGLQFVQSLFSSFTRTHYSEIVAEGTDWYGRRYVAGT